MQFNDMTKAEIMLYIAIHIAPALATSKGYLPSTGDMWNLSGQLYKKYLDERRDELGMGKE